MIRKPQMYNLMGRMHLSDKRYLHLSDSSSMHLSDLSMHLSDTCICFTKYTSIVRFVFQNHDVMCQNITRKCIMLTTSTHGYTLVYIYIYTLTLLNFT